LEVLCGGSFRDPMEKLAQLFERETGTKMVLSYGQSEDLLPQVKLHERGDVFVTHDPYPEYTSEADALLRAVPVGYVAPVLVTAKGDPKGVTSLEDLAKPGLRVCLPNPDFSTCGEMVFALLEKKGIKDAVMANVGNALFRSHSEIASAISLGHRDAGVMWNGVAHNWLDKIDVVPTPYEYDEEIRVNVMGLSYSKRRERVESFLEFTAKRGEEVFREFGYVR
jgi:molybdate transport system substrate-binding protein